MLYAMHITGVVLSLAWEVVYTQLAVGVRDHTLDPQSDACLLLTDLLSVAVYR